MADCFDISDIIGIECRYCGSYHTISHTDAELRQDHLLEWQCLECGEWFRTGWDIDD